MTDESPLHGFQGDRLPAGPPALPLAPSVAIGREVGARGGEIARRLGAKLGWPVYDRETLGYVSRQPEAVESLLAELPPTVVPWIAGRLRGLHHDHILLDDSEYEREARLILALGAKGEAIFVGRGAGYLLPRDTTLHVRVVAPLVDRVAYMAQWLRLSREEAEEQVRVRSKLRAHFLATCVRPPADGLSADMVLNSSALGEEVCVDLIILALRSKRGAAEEDLTESRLSGIES